MFPRARLLLVSLLALSSACASSSQRTRTTVDRNRITSTELAASTETNLYDYVAKHRPRWLTPRGSGSIPGRGRGTSVGGSAAVAVYLDEAKQGGLEILRGLSASGVRTIRFFDVTEAEQRFPDARGSAVIQVLTR